jgi:tripeptidyl-peptidase-1
VSSTIITPQAEPACYLPISQGGIDCSKNPLGEIGVSLRQGTPWSTGGGFSNIQRQPSYQSSFVSKYLDYLTKKKLIPPSSVFNASGRAYPDVVSYFVIYLFVYLFGS